MRTILSTTRSTRTRVTATVAVAVLALGLSACGSDDGEAVEGSAADSSPSASASPSESTAPATGTPAEGGETASSAPAEPAEPAGPSIDVTVEGDQVSPNAETLEIEVGQPLTLNIVSDRAGEFHVHAKPEQYVDFEAGNTTTELVVETPGSVEIEEHDSGAVIALLEVR